VYEDEVDIHLNPKIGVDWMPRGIQKEVLTPGKNAKAYVAGALDARSRDIVWVGGSEKTSALFVALLDEAIERFWQDLHANVTRNHKHADLPSLCSAVAEYLDGASPWLPKDSRPSKNS